MRKVYLILICIAVVMMSLPCLYAKSAFKDIFNDETKISYKSNVKITGNKAEITNPVVNKKGILISTNITRASNEKWESFIVNGNFSNLLSSIKISVLYTNNNETNLFTIDENNPKRTFNDLYKVITNRSIKLKAFFEITFSSITPELLSWEVTVTEPPSGKPPDYPDKFYGYPSPFIIESGKSRITFRYSTKLSDEPQADPINKSCKVTLKILDPNYNLVKIVCDNKLYPLSGYNRSWLDEEWDGKNGNGIPVTSGLYIAKLEINYDDGTKPNITPFRFAVIR